MDKAQQAYQYFLSKGYSPQAAAGIVGNLIHESNLNTSAEGDKGYKGGSSFGIAQWRMDRLDRLKKFAGDNWTDFNKQLDFVDWELNNTHKGAKTKLVSAKDVNEAGEAFSDLYEIPQKKYKQDQNRRAKVENVFSKFSGLQLPQQQEAVVEAQDFYAPKHSDNANFILPNQQQDLAVEDEVIPQDIQNLNEISFLDDLLSNMPELTYVAPDPILVGGAQEVFQSGGTWKKQQEDLRQEKLEQLKKLKDQEKPTYQTKQTQPKKETAQTEKDATRVESATNQRRFSKVARNKTDKEIAEERQARIDAQAEANNRPFDWSNFRQELSDRSQATGDALRVSNYPNFFDDYLNPAAMIGSMADNLGQAPLQAEQTDSYLPYVTAIGTPLAVGALAGIGAQNTGQFVNNLANPLAGVKNPFRKGNVSNSISTEEVTDKGIRLIHYSDNPNLRFEDVDLFRPGTSQRKRSMRNKPLEELPGGFYTTADENSRFMGGNLGYEMYLPSDAKILDLASTGRVTDRIPIRELQQYREEGYDLIKGRNMLRQDEYIPLNKEKMTGWNQFTQNRRGQTEFQEGGEKNSLWRNIRRNRGSSRKPTKEMLEQERKIKNKKEEGGYQLPISPNGVYDFPNQKVIVPTSGEITMKNVEYPLKGTSLETGETKLMKPNQDYFFPNTQTVLEEPLTENERDFLNELKTKKFARK
jgi:hypothetical protein